MYDFILVDINSVGHANNASPRLNVGDLETQAVFGTLNYIRDIKDRYGRSNVICIWDGYAKWRYDLYPEYKGKRKLDPNKTPKPYEIEAQKRRESYREQKPYMAKGLELLGVTQLMPQDHEADDVAGFMSVSLSKKGKKVLLVSRDHDWLQLVDKNVSWFNPVYNETVNSSLFKEYTGYKEATQFVAEKCLVGDTSDNINGVMGIGAKAAPLILNHYKHPSFMICEIQAAGDSWIPPIKELNRYRNKLTAFAANDSDGQKIFNRNYRLMSLLEVEKPRNVEQLKTPFNKSGFEEFCHEMAFHSIIRKQKEWLKPFTRQEA